MSKNILEDAPPAVQKLMNDLWSDLQRDSNQREADAAQADPVKHRLSKVMQAGQMGYCYIEHRDGRGARVRFCYSKHRNVAGYFLLWREVETKKKLMRDQWDATTSKACAVRTMRELSEAYANKKQATT